MGGKRRTRARGRSEGATDLRGGVGHRSNNDGRLGDHRLDLVDLETGADGDEELALERFSGDLGEERGDELGLAAVGGGS